MQDKLKEIPKKILEWWNRFSIKQKLILCGVVAGVLALVIILVSILTKPSYTELLNCDSTKEASEVVELLEGDGLTYKVSSDGLKIEILDSQLSQARLLLGENDIPTSTYSLEEALSGGLSTTESDKQKKVVKALQSQLENDLEHYTFVKDAVVILNIPEDDGTLISTGVEASAAVCLELSGELTTEMAQAMARFVATSLGNETTDNIVIMDMDGNLYFSGADDGTAMGSANSQLAIKQQAESTMITQVRQVLSGTGEFSMISVAPNLDLDFSSTEIVDHTFDAPDGRTEGYLSQEDRYESETTSGNGGIPGTTSNDETVSYDIDLGNESSETVTEYHREYVLDESISSKTIPPGLVQYDTSTIAVTALRHNIIKEEDARSQGLLDGISWDEYKAANSTRTKLEVDDDWISIVANATGIPKENVTFVVYSENVFIDKEDSGIKASDVLQVLLIIIILALLAFVVLRSMRGDKRQSEEELSVEDLLQSTPAEELEEISSEAKSDTRILIEKFVDENPEAAANLLRNWLNEDWG